MLDFFWGSFSCRWKIQNDLVVNSSGGKLVSDWCMESWVSSVRITISPFEKPVGEVSQIQIAMAERSVEQRSPTAAPKPAVRKRVSFDAKSVSSPNAALLADPSSGPPKQSLVRLRLDSIYL